MVHSPGCGCFYAPGWMPACWGCEIASGFAVDQDYPYSPRCSERKVHAQHFRISWVHLFLLDFFVSQTSGRWTSSLLATANLVSAGCEILPTIKRSDPGNPS